MAYLLDAGTLAEVLRTAPTRSLVRRLTTVPPRDRWTSVISVSQLLLAARRSQRPRLMQDVIRLVAAVKVAPFDVQAAQSFAKLRATVAPDGAPDDVDDRSHRARQRLHPRHTPAGGLRPLPPPARRDWTI